MALALAGVALVALWLARRPLTEVTVSSMLAARGVDARYRIAEASPRRLVFDDVRLGPTAAPDLVARRIAVELGGTPLSPQVTAVRLDGVLVRVRTTDDGIGFGSLDRLIPEGGSTRFPPIAVTVAGGTMLATTPVGSLVGRIAANGRLDRDFRAVVQLDSARLGRGACRGTSGPAALVVTTAGSDFDVRGSGTADRIDCGALIANARWAARLRGPITLATLAGAVDVAAPTLTAGPLRARASTVRLTADGPPDRLAGTWVVRSRTIGTARDNAAGLAGDGRLEWRRGAPVTLAGTVRADALALRSLAGVFERAAFPGLAATLARRAAAAARAVDVRADVAATLDSSPVLRITAVDATARGAKLRFAGVAGWNLTGADIAGRVDLAGGGLPAARLDLDRLQSGAAGWRGTGRIMVAPWRDGRDRLAVPAARLTLAGNRVAAAGRVMLSSAFSGGRVDGLDVAGAGFAGPAGHIATRGCLTAAWQRIAAGTAVVAPAAARLCPAGAAPLLAIAGERLAGSADLGALRLRGTIGGQKFELGTRLTRVTLGGTTARPVVASPGLTLAGGTDALSGQATLSGQFSGGPGGWTGSGRISGARAAVAVAASEGSGDWRLTDDRIVVTDAAFRIADRVAPARFAPLRLTGGTATIGGERTTARATLRLADGGAPLATVDGEYAVGTGSARLASTLTFSDKLQPVQISEFARGLVANVRGTVTARADLRLAGGILAGTGSVRLDEVSLATAALGPVTGIDGTIVFDDLPALHTPPGQVLRIASIEPGVRVDDGIATFQLQGPDTAAVERVVWPFAGGTLTLQPVTLAAAIPRRSFALAVDGLDAEQFLQRFELDNLNVTGKFDGVLPLVFDGGVGRIEGGVLTARAPGGVLQYVGEVGQASIGGAGRLAFDALRRLRYRRLALRLDGDLDGELVTAIDFTGTNEVPVRAAGIRATGLPFKFGVRVTAPFRALLGTAASLSDARTVIRGAQTPP